MTVVSRVPVDEITQAARQVQPSKILLEIIATPFYILGWLTFWLVVGGARAVVWVVVAVKFGWIDAAETAAARGMTMPVWPSGPAEDRTGVGTR